jgi:hypothetical protein
LTPAQTLEGPTNVTFSNIISDGRKFVFPKSHRTSLSTTSAEQHEVISPESAALTVPLTPIAAPRSLKYK